MNAPDVNCADCGKVYTKGFYHECVPQPAQTALTPEQIARKHGFFVDAAVAGCVNAITEALTQERAATEKLQQLLQEAVWANNQQSELQVAWDGWDEWQEKAKALLPGVKYVRSTSAKAVDSLSPTKETTAESASAKMTESSVEARLKQVEAELRRVREAYSWFTDEIRKAVHGDEWGYGRDHKQYVYDTAGLKMQKELAESRTGRLERILVGATAIVYSNDTIMGAERLDDFRKQLRLPTPPEGSKGE